MFRKLWNLTLSQTNATAHIPLQEAEGIAVLYNTLHNPEDFYKEMRRYSASLTLSIAYGKRATTFDNVDASGFSVKHFYELEHKFNCAFAVWLRRWALTGTFPVFLEVGAAPPIDIIPALKYAPRALAPWKKQAQETRDEMKALYLERLFREVKLKMENGMRTGCWMEQIIDRNDGLDVGASQYHTHC